MTNILLDSTGQTSEVNVLVFDESLTEDYLRLPQRGYDFRKGDRRFSDLERAIEHGNEEARRTGIRQVVRVDTGSYDFLKLYLVQAVGS